jgi:hypothetical protein
MVYTVHIKMYKNINTFCNEGGIDQGHILEGTKVAIDPPLNPNLRNRLYVR